MFQFNAFFEDQRFVNWNKCVEDRATCKFLQADPFLPQPLTERNFRQGSQIAESSNPPAIKRLQQFFINFCQNIYRKLFKISALFAFGNDRYSRESACRQHRCVRI